MIDWPVCLSACVGAFVGMGLAILAFGRPIRVSITMPKPVVQVLDMRHGREAEE